MVVILLYSMIKWQYHTLVTSYLLLFIWLAESLLSSLLYSSLYLKKSISSVSLDYFRIEAGMIDNGREALTPPSPGQWIVIFPMINNLIVVDSDNLCLVLTLLHGVISTMNLIELVNIYRNKIGVTSVVTWNFCVPALYFPIIFYITVSLSMMRLVFKY